MASSSAGNSGSGSPTVSGAICGKKYCHSSVAVLSAKPAATADPFAPLPATPEGLVAKKPTQAFQKRGEGFHSPASSSYPARCSGRGTGEINTWSS